MKRTILTLFALLLFPVATALGQPNAWINEFHYDNDGGDTGEFIEIVLEDAGSYTLSNIQVLHYNGADGDSDAAAPVTLDQFTAGTTSGGFTVYSYDYTANGETLQNSDEGLALCFDSNTDGTHETLLTSGGVDQFLSYEGTVTGTAGDGCAGGQTSTDIGVSESSSTPAGESLQLSGTGSAYNDFTWNAPATESPGSANAGQTLSTGPIENVTQGTFHNTIQEALDNAAANDEILISNGTYTVGSQINGFKPGVTLRGASESGVTIDATAVSGWALFIDDGNDDVTLKDFTIQGGGDETIKVNFLTGLSVENVTAKGSAGNEIDLNNVTDATLTDFTADGDGTAGVGIALTGVQNVTLDGVTTTGNNWGGVGIFDTNPSVSPPSGWTLISTPTNIEIVGSSFSEPVSVYTDNEFGGGIGDLILPNFDYTVENPDFRDSIDDRGEDFVFYKKAEQGAIDLAADGLASPSSSYIRTLTRDGSGVVSQTDSFIVGISSGGTAMSIQAAVDAAGSGGGNAVAAKATGPTVNILSGTYEQQVVVTTDNLTLSGVGSGSTAPSNTIIKSPTSLSYSFSIGSNDNFPIVGIDGAAGVTVENVRIDGAGRGNGNNRFIGVAFWNAGGTVMNSYITGIQETPFSGSQHGVGIYANNDTGGPYSVDVSGTTINEFQKNGIALSGSGLTVDIDNNTVTGKGSIGVTALNGIQVGYGATGSITNNTVTHIAYSGDTWASGAILTLFASGTLTVDNNTVSESQVSLWFHNNSATITGNDVSDPATVGVGSWGAILDPDGSDDLPTLSPVDAGSEKSARAKSATISFTFDDNKLVGTDASGSVGVDIYSSGETLSATGSGNLIKDFAYGVLVGEASDGLVQSVMLTENCIISNEEIGLSNEATLTVDATNNWWGSAAGPGTSGANGTDGPVTATPFATEPISGIEGCGGSGGGGQCDIPTLAGEVVDEGNRTVSNTIVDQDGIVEFEFTQLTNFTVDNIDPSGIFTQNGDVWTLNAGEDPPTEVDYTLLAGQESSATYFIKITDACEDPGPQTAELDPQFDFGGATPAVFALGNNYPNPFREATTIHFTLPESTPATLNIYDLMGRKVATLISGNQSAGTHEIRWDGRGDGGARLASGLYLVRLKAGERVQTSRLTIVR